MPRPRIAGGAFAMAKQFRFLTSFFRYCMLQHECGEFAAPTGRLCVEIGHVIIRNMLWIIGAAILLGALASAFVIIARKGRTLRLSRPLPPTATVAHLQWVQSGEDRRIDVFTPFYVGKSS